MSESSNPRSLAIQALILDRCRALGLSRSELAQLPVDKSIFDRCGLLGDTNPLELLE